MDEYTSRQDVITTIRENGVYGSGYSNEEREDNVVDMIESIPAADVVSRDAFNRLLAENDTMRAQLAQIGKKPGDSMDDVRLGVYTVKEALNNYGVDVTKLWQTATAQKRRWMRPMCAERMTLTSKRRRKMIRINRSGPIGRTDDG